MSNIAGSSVRIISGTAGKTARSRAASEKTRQRMLAVIAPLALLLVWEIIVDIGLTDRRLVPPPSGIALTFVSMIASGELLGHLAATLYRVGAGYFLAIVPGVALGLMMAMWKPVRYALDPVIAALFPVPKIALMPLLLLAFGFGEASKIAVVAIAAFFPILINTYSGAANIEKIYIDAARNFGATPAIMFRKVVLLGAMPMIFTGLRLALGLSLLIVVAAEFVAAEEGVGQLIWVSWELLQVDRMFVGVVTMGVLGVLTTVLLQELEQVVIPWKQRA